MKDEQEPVKAGCRKGMPGREQDVEARDGEAIWLLLGEPKYSGPH